MSTERIIRAGGTTLGSFGSSFLIDFGTFQLGLTLFDDFERFLSGFRFPSSPIPMGYVYTNFEFLFGKKNKRLSEILDNLPSFTFTSEYPFRQDLTLVPFSRHKGSVSDWRRNFVKTQIKGARDLDQGIAISDLVVSDHSENTIISDKVLFVHKDRRNRPLSSPSRGWSPGMVSSTSSCYM
jgi:hypothetical protein